MAPPNGSAKPRKPGGGSKLAQAPKKPVVPAIPLPYVKRQAAAAAAAAASSNANPSTEAPKPETRLENGIVTVPAGQDSPADAAAHEEVVMPLESGPNLTDSTPKSNNQGFSVETVSESTATVDQPDEAAKALSMSPHPDHPTEAPDDVHAQASDAQPTFQAPEKRNGVVTQEERKQLPGEKSRLGDGWPSTDRRIAVEHPHVLSQTTRPPPPISPSRYQMPPPFQPANRPSNLGVNGDMSRGSRPPGFNGPPSTHQPHPSNSSVHFGTFHDSSSSSPAPPYGGGIAPPPGMPMPDGRAPFMGFGGSGFPPMMPQDRDMMPFGTFDNTIRPSMAYGPIDSYHPYGNNFGPSTPHSFHDSQTSGHRDENSNNHNNHNSNNYDNNHNNYNNHSQYPSAPLRNGASGPGEGSQSPNHPGGAFAGPDYSRMMPNHSIPSHMMAGADDADGLVGYLQQQFAPPQFGDCTLEVRFTNSQLEPMVIPGHRIIFARSPELARSLHNQSSQSDFTAVSQQVIRLNTDNKWARFDSFYLAVQRLYGLPLFHIPQPPPGMKQENIIDAGSFNQRFDFALSYAVAGHLLGWESVARRGCDIANMLLNWQTMERALEFALEEHRDQGSHDIFKYREGSGVILNGAITYVINNLPPNFAIDTSLPDPVAYARLPSIPPPPPSTINKTLTSPVNSYGTPVHLGRGRRSQQITGIQFGDLSVAEAKNAAALETPKASQQARPASHAVLSRVLLNIPFSHLKMALESAGLNDLNGWADAEYRYRIIKDAVGERERRRIQAVDAVKAGRISNWEQILTQLSSPEPRYFDKWSALGWKEEILPGGSPNGPALGRSWVPLMTLQNGTTQYP
ncbi:hypothetical protein G7046_g3315 [Stylonectria norvegica]|nr:hypothetical protein G7046_g3315 [Stylonectria norvegica]